MCIQKHVKTYQPWEITTIVITSWTQVGYLCLNFKCPSVQLGVECTPHFDGILGYKTLVG